MKKKKSVQKKNAGIPAARPAIPISMRRSDSVLKNQNRPAYGSIGRSFALLLDRTKACFIPAEKIPAEKTDA